VSATKASSKCKHIDSRYQFYEYCAVGVSFGWAQCTAIVNFIIASVQLNLT